MTREKLPLFFVFIDEINLKKDVAVKCAKRWYSFPMLTTEKQFYRCPLCLYNVKKKVLRIFNVMELPKAVFTNVPVVQFASVI